VQDLDFILGPANKTHLPKPAIWQGYVDASPQREEYRGFAPICLDGCSIAHFDGAWRPG
jgi:hypothetical protein